MPQKVQNPANETEIALQRVLTKNGVPGAGDGAGFAPKGALCIDYANGNLYINGGTQTTPAWKLVTRAA
ncbi:MAG TPA: hypothetical protein VHC20_06175 [Candidatus Paceibacterota bacterium]|nr:hypothetical protein [Candidatus Paceibacterota bacterium]